jgi:hypothetical protein
MRVADFSEYPLPLHAFSSPEATGAGFALLFFKAAILPLVRLQKAVINLLHDAAKGRT